MTDLTPETRAEWREDDWVEYGLDPRAAHARILALLDALDKAERERMELRQDRDGMFVRLLRAECQHTGGVVQKYDGGRGATLCADCYTVLATGRNAPAPDPWAEPPSDEASMHIDPEPPGVTMRPFTDAEVAALDAEPPSGCGTCGGAGLVPEAHDGGTHPVHCPEGCDLPPSDHECDTGNFDRTVCPEPCGRMHSYCDTCGERQDDCAHEPTSEGDRLRERLRLDAEAEAKRPAHEKRHMPAIAESMAPTLQNPPSEGEVTADELLALLPKRTHPECVAAILARFDVRRRP